MRARIAMLVIALLLVGCSNNSGNAHRSATSTSTPRPVASNVAWAGLRNPIVVNNDFSLKDPALVAFDGGWVMLFSRADRAGTWRIGISRSLDLRTWSIFETMPHDAATAGEASPDVTQSPDGTYVVTYQSFPHDRDGSEAKLYARTTKDFRTFSAPIRLAASVHKASGDRLIDAALAWSPAGLVLGFKFGTTTGSQAQHFEIARSTTGTLAGPWQLIGRPHITVYGDTIENYEFLHLDRGWTLLATSNQFDKPELFQLRGNPSQTAAWMSWSPARELRVPQEQWNPGRGLTGTTYEHANGAFLVDRRSVDGYAYLVYEDAPTMTGFDGQGRGALAIARSTDLVNWTVPG